MVEKEIQAKKIAGVLCILIPMVFWMLTYIRFGCPGGRCSIGMEWLIIGYLMTLFGMILLLSSDDAGKKS